MKGIVEHLRKGGIPLQTVCANALFKVRSEKYPLLEVK